MLEHIPQWLGATFRNVRAGHSKLVIVQEDVGVPDARIDLSSPAFADGARLPVRFTADGEGVSPPLVWSDAPDTASSFALIVEDPDAPTLGPIVHALVWGIPGDERRLAEGAITRDDGGLVDGRDVGRNSYFAEGWLPPDPPTGHGTHDYVFQLFALSETPVIGPNPGRSELVRAISGRVIGAGLLTGTYSRGETATAENGTLRAAQA